MPRGRPRKKAGGNAEALLRQMLIEGEQQTKSEIAELIRTKPISIVLAVLDGTTTGKRQGRPPKGTQQTTGRKAGRKRAKRRTSGQMAQAKAETAARLKVRKQMKMLRGPIPADRKQAFNSAVKAELAKG